MLKRDYAGQACSVARALELVGERWTLLIVRDAFLGLHRFDEFQESLGIARNVLTDRLNRLVEEGIFERVPYSEHPQGFRVRPGKAGVTRTRFVPASSKLPDDSFERLAHLAPVLLADRKIVDARRRRSCSVGLLNLQIKPDFFFSPRQDEDALLHGAVELDVARRRGVRQLRQRVLELAEHRHRVALEDVR